MLYIVVALKPEAQAFVDRYKLKKSKPKDFTQFSNEFITLIVSGIGVNNSVQATQTLINHYDISDDDTFLNIGIAAAEKRYKIGTLLEIGNLNYKHKTYKLNSLSDKTLTCLDCEAFDDTYKIVDMESFGFYDAVKHSPAIKRFYILKVISDHFEPRKVTKEATKSLIFNAIDAINEILN